MRASLLTVFAFTVVAFSLGATRDPASAVVFDQSHADPSAFELYHNVGLHEPVGQSFQPVFGALDFVDLWLLDIGSWESEEGSIVQVILRADGLAGEVLSASDSIRVENGFDGVVRFVFNRRIQTEKDRDYLVELIHLEGEPVAVRNYGDLFPPYERGSLFLHGKASQRSDMWFRTGVTIEEIEIIQITPSRVAWLGVTPLGFEVWESADLQHWEFVEKVYSNTNTYAFETSELGAQSRFYQIRFSGE